MRNLSELDLSICGFNGTIPNSLSNLTKLSYLDLSLNSFTGPMTLFSVPKKLSHLGLSNNDLSGLIPSSHFEGMHNLFEIDLSYNSFTGSIPSSLFALPSLQQIKLSHNKFSELDGFINVTSSTLEILDISNNNLSGSFPAFIFQLNSSLTDLSLSSNKFEWSVLPKIHSVSVTNADMFSFPYMEVLEMASCNLKTIPGFLKNCSSLVLLDLSDNQIQGIVPNWIWKLDNLVELNISHNFLTGLEGPFKNLTGAMVVIDLHHNKIQGPMPVLPKSADILDFSSNKFSSIPQDIGNRMPFTYYVSLSNNTLHGNIPYSLCNASYLQVLDLSINNISGTIPSCLMMMMNGTLEALNLKNNNLSGPIPNTVPVSCGLWNLNLRGNQLDGSIPKSLAYCSKLEVLDLGSNQITGGFPCFLKEISTLRVLVLRNNKFQGSLKCLKANKTWEMLQIVDIAFNNFSGKLPRKYFTTWKRNITGNKEEAGSKFIEKQISSGDGLYYRDSITVTNKGQQMELVKILTIFTSIDFSSNHFDGPIPQELMDWKELYVLNLSNNAFSGKIPSSIGNMRQLESLDLSQNSLSGEIPVQLASLSFLSYLNLSFNHLVGKIPTSTQLQSFSASSFEGNDGLYGPPLTKNPDHKEQEVLPQQECGRLACTIDWNFISVEMGLIFGHGVIFGPLLIWKQWRLWYWQLVHKILCQIFPRVYLECVTRRGQTYEVLRWRH
ncbi:hypothetical protein GLYMA_03G055300v4 [Glycine max]|nr:hypothetical protein GLYMA_03G055300v4 [Glycine max]